MSRIPSLVRPREARVHLLAWFLLVLGSFAQRPGRTTFDTKFDLTADPVRFLGRSLHLWNPDSAFGELQNQAYGYLFPQGPFFVLGHLLDVPMWVTQRLWTALLLVVAYEGARRLAAAIGVRPWWAAAISGGAYAVTPRLLSEVGTLTGEIVPTAVLPWVVLPLVAARAGRLSPRTGALLSAVAILCMGGLNAVENLAALPLPFLVAMTSPSGLRARLTGWWVAGVALASAWWLLPLFLLGSYSPPFLDYVETATTTTRPLSWSNVVRGADHWLAFVTVGGRPWWPAGYALATEALLVLVTGVVAALGIAGLARRSMPLRGALLGSLLVGFACLHAGHAGALGSLVADPVRTLLDGPLAALRNVHKVDPLVRLPLALGAGHATAGVVERFARRDSRRLVLRRLPVVPVVLSVVVGLVLLSALPVLRGQLRTPGWKAVPTAWSQVATYLDRHAEDGRALIVPGSGFGLQTWGTTIDEPLQGLARSPWATRNQVPLTPGQTIRFLDSIESRVDGGAGSPFLADALARAGIGYVVDRHDLDLRVSDAPASLRVDRALERSPGLTRVRSYGETWVGGQSLIDVYRVDRPVAKVQLVDRSSVRTFQGAADDVLSILESGLVRRDQPLVALHEPGWGTDEADYVADGYRLRERQFGRTTDALGSDMTPHDRYRAARPVHDYPATDGTPRAHLDAGAIESMDASTSAGFADALGAVRPEHGPYAAVDAGLETSWLSAPFTRPRGQWLSLHLFRATPIGTVRIQTDTTIGVTERVLSVRVTSGGQSSTAQVDPDTGGASVTLDGSRQRDLRVEITRVAGDPRYGLVGINDLSIAGLPRHVQLVVPRAPMTSSGTWVLRADPGRRACLPTLAGPDCDLSAARAPEASVELARRIDLRAERTLFVTGQVVAQATDSTAALTQPFGNGVRIHATSVLGDDPAVSGQFAFDGSLSTSWVAQPGERTPTLQLSWPGRRTVGRLQVVNSLSGGIAPREAVVSALGQRRIVRLGPDGLGFFRPLRTNHLRVTFRLSDDVTKRGSLAIAELKLPGLAGLRFRPQPAARTGATCGLGPPLHVDGRRHPTYVTGSLDAVLNGGPLRLGLCGKPLTLGPGRHALSLRATPQFAASQLVLSPRATPSDTVTSRDVTVTTWHDTRRTLRVGGGEAALLRVPENANPGWQATLHGRVLRPVDVDGWQQGWLVPASAAGTIQLRFLPDSTYRTGLLAGGIAAFLLVLGAVVSLLLDRRRGRRSPIVVAEPLGRAPRMVLLACGALVAVVVGGVAVAGGLLVGAILWPRRAWLGVVAAGLVAASAAVAAGTAAWGDTVAPLAANLLAGLGVGVLCVSLGVSLAASRLAARREAR